DHREQRVDLAGDGDQLDPRLLERSAAVAGPQVADTSAAGRRLDQPGDQRAVRVPGATPDLASVHLVSCGGDARDVYSKATAAHTLGPPGGMRTPSPGRSALQLVHFCGLLLNEDDVLRQSAHAAAAVCAEAYREIRALGVIVLLERKPKADPERLVRLDLGQSPNRAIGSVAAIRNRAARDRVLMNHGQRDPAVGRLPAIREHDRVVVVERDLEFGECSVVPQFLVW